MGVLVPSRCGSAVLGFAAGSIVYSVIGPLRDGAWVRGLRLAFNVYQAAAGSTAILFAASMGSSSEATQAALDAGLSLVERSPSRIGGTPAAALSFRQDLMMELYVPWGVQAEWGARYVVLAVNPTVAITGAALLASVEAVEVLEPLGEVVGGSRNVLI